MRDFPEGGGFCKRLIEANKTNHAQSRDTNDKLTQMIFVSLGKMKKPGTEGNLIQPFNSAPELALSEDDTVWIADSASSRIQIHEGVQGRVVGSFKTTLQGVALKPRGVTTLAGGRKVRTSINYGIKITSVENTKDDDDNATSVCAHVRTALQPLILGKE